MARGQHRNVIEPPRRTARENLFSAAFFVEYALVLLLPFAAWITLLLLRNASDAVYVPGTALAVLLVVIAPFTRGRLRRFIRIEESAPEDRARHHSLVSK